MTRRSGSLGRVIPIAAAGVFLAAVAGTACSRPVTDVAAGRTNLLLVVIDTLRADHSSAWGYRAPTTPRLDGLAAEGIRFDRFFSTSAWTRPGMASMLTGLYPRATGVYEERYDGLDPALTTLPERLQARGYFTAAVTANPNINAWFGFDQGFTRYGDAGVVWPWMPADPEQHKWKRGRHELETASSLTRRTLDLVDRDRRAFRTRPWFLMALYLDPHWPYQPPTDDQAAMRAARSHTPGYDGEIAFADREMGKLLDGLRERGLMRDTLVIVTSDHGEGLRDHPSVPFSDTHGSILYDSVLHVPLVLQHPALPKGVVVDELVSMVDLVPTLADLVDLPLPAGELPGHSLVPLLKGQPRPGELPDRVYAETDFRINRKVAVRTPRWLYIRNDDCRAFQVEGAHEGRSLTSTDRRILNQVPPVELYPIPSDRRQDPQHGDRLALYPEEAAALASSLTAWEAVNPARPPLRRDPEDCDTRADGTVVPAVSASEAPVLDPALIERLKALGYLGDGDEADRPAEGHGEGG